MVLRILSALILVVSIIPAAGVDTAAQIVYEVDPIVVTADRVSQRSRDALSSVTVITREEIDALHAENLGDVLRLVPGVQIQQSGSIGNLTQVRLRGTESSHILFLVNGMEINDPFFGGFDIAHLGADEIERVEIVRGTQTALYGADAIGGVVNVILREDGGAERFRLSGEMGEYGFTKLSGGVNGSERGINYALNVSHLESDGLNWRDAYHNTSASAVARMRSGDDMTMSFGLLFTEYFKELPFSYYFDFTDMSYRQYIDPNNAQEGEAITGFAETNHVFKDRFKSSVRLGTSYNRLRNTNAPDSDPGFENTSLNTKKLDLLMSERIELTSETGLLLSWQWQDENASRLDNSLYAAFTSVDERITISSLSATLHAGFGERIKFLAGLRSDKPSLFSSHLSPQMSAAARIPVARTRVRAGWSEGFRVPTLSDLFFPQYGNPSLQPETAVSYEAGFDQPLPSPRWFADAHLSVTFFKLDITNMIAFNELTWVKENFAEAHYSGVEMEYSSLLGSRGLVRTSYTHQRTRGIEQDDEHRLVRRPKDAFNFFLAFKPSDSSELSAEYIYTGSQLIALTFVTHEGDQVHAGESLASHGIVTVGAEYSIPDRYTFAGKSALYVRIMNLFDERYEEIRGYPAPGRMVAVGARFGM